MNFVEINQKVEVIVRFGTKGQKATMAFPVKMRWGHKEIAFTELGLRHPTAQGKRMIHVFDMSDGANDYRLEFDAETLTWTLVSILGGR